MEILEKSAQSFRKKKLGLGDKLLAPSFDDIEIFFSCAEIKKNKPGPPPHMEPPLGPGPPSFAAKITLLLNLFVRASVHFPLSPQTPILSQKHQHTVHLDRKLRPQRIWIPWRNHLVCASANTATRLLPDSSRHAQTRTHHMLRAPKGPPKHIAVLLSLLLSRLPTCLLVGRCSTTCSLPPHTRSTTAQKASTSDITEGLMLISLARPLTLFLIDSSPPSLLTAFGSYQRQLPYHGFLGRRPRLGPRFQPSKDLPYHQLPSATRC